MNRKEKTIMIKARQMGITETIYYKVKGNISKKMITVDIVIEENGSIYATSVPRNIILNIQDRRIKHNPTPKKRVRNVSSI